MNPNLTKRGFIRILSYFTALCVFLGVGALINYQAAQRYRQNSEYGYQRALSDLSDSVSGGGAGKGSLRQHGAPAARHRRQAAEGKQRRENLPGGAASVL